jgi:hypothetical protein
LRESAAAIPLIRYLDSLLVMNAACCRLFVLIILKEDDRFTVRLLIQHLHTLP